MAIERDSMIVYQSWLEAIHELPEALQGELALAILEVGLEGEAVCKIGQTTKAMLALIRPMIEANNRKYENGCKGGRPQKKNQTETEEKPNQNQNETKTKPICNMIYDDISITTIGGNAHTREDEDLDGTTVAVTSLAKVMLSDAKWVTRVARNLQKTEDDICALVRDFCAEQEIAGANSREIGEARKHFINWQRKKLNQNENKRGLGYYGRARNRGVSTAELDEAIAAGIAIGSTRQEWEL